MEVEKRRLPALPLSALPYFHGVQHGPVARRTLLGPNTFLLFLDADNKKKLAVMIMDAEQNVHTVYVNTDGILFWFTDEDRSRGFTVVQQLVDYYVENEKALIVLSEHDQQAVTLVLLGHRVNSQHFLTRELQLEPCLSLQDCSYMHGIISNEKLSMLLEKDGDYLISLEPKGRTIPCLYVRWNGEIEMIRCRVDATRGMYVLPSRGNAVLKEYVSTLDELIKSAARCGAEVHGIMFKRPVKHEPKMVINLMTGETFENVRPLFTASQEARVSAKPYSLLNLRSPLAFDHLPYYHGVNCPDMLYGLLKSKGDFLLCTNSITGDLHLLLRSSVRSDISVFSFVVQYHKIKEVFYLNSNDCEQWFTNVEELIEYYVQYRLPVDGVGIVSGTSRKPINEDLTLVNPVVCWDQVSHLYLEDVNSDHDLSYFYGAIPLENAQTLLTYSGDFLLLYNDNEKLFVLALWGDRFVQIDMEPSPGDGLYKLPTANESEPKESLASVDEYLKALITTKTVVNGVVLHRPVRWK
uniref:SH2 domain-containing protein n=1 Tax=Trichuris muris TaxID=70415 RepID=A0A5S6QKX8_TRIMR